MRRCTRTARSMHTKCAKVPRSSLSFHRFISCTGQRLAPLPKHLSWICYRSCCYSII